MFKMDFKKLHRWAKLPTYATSGASGFDLYALEWTMLSPGETQAIRTGWAVAVPEGYELQIRPRSGLSLKTNLRVANSPGTIDSDYRGELCVIVTNIGTEAQEIIERGDRIAQGVVCPIVRVAINKVDKLDETIRGNKGLGSTGQ
jgi:dUTP pyrophosphatase